MMKRLGLLGIEGKESRPGGPGGQAAEGRPPEVREPPQNVAGRAQADELKDFLKHLDTLEKDGARQVQELSGEPDSVDSLVATTFANVAMDLVESGLTGRMVAIQDGKYAHTELPDPALGPRKVDVPVMYNAARFRPRYDGKLGDPMLLVGLD